MNQGILFVAMTFLPLLSCKKDEADDPVVLPPTQVPVKVMVEFKNNGGAYDFSSYIEDANGRSVQFNKVRMILSNFKLISVNGSVSHAFPITAVLLDRALGQYVVSDLGLADQGLFARLAFDIGLDAATNQMSPSEFTQPPLSDQTLWINAASGHKFFTLEGRVDSDGDGIVESSEQVVTYQCITSAMLRSDELNMNTSISGSPWTFVITVDMTNILNGFDCITTPTAVGSGAVNAQLMSNLQAAIHV